MTRKSKSLHSLTIEGIHTQTQLRYNINTNYIGIINSFSGHGLKPLNKLSSNYLGITCAEKVLEKVFKNIEKMPFGNPGYDFICNNGFLVDSKSACKNKQNEWHFVINKNKTADYFALLAFDNRESINPLYFWLIPGNIVNDKITISISKSTINKWDEYKQSINKVIKCCDILKGDK